MKNKLDIRKALTLLIALNATLIIIITGFMMYLLYVNKWQIVNEYFGEYLILIFAVLSTLINSFLGIKMAYKILYSDKINNNLIKSLKNMDNLNITLRSQRHDFLNHLQVVSCLIEMDEFVEAKSYINKVYCDINSVSRLLKTSITALNALLKVKLYSCENRNINVELEVLSNLKDFPIPDWEFCSVIGNLIDNAIEALNDKEDNKKLQIKITENIDNFIFEILDNGKNISDGLKTNIFRAGFTTKGSKNSGMGLYISKQILESYNSKIILENSDDNKIFRIYVPRKKFS